MHELAFADAARPTPVSVLILRLQDYTLGHELLLLRQRNPLLVLDREEFNQLPEWQQIRALKSAVIICSQTWVKNQTPPGRLWLWLWNWMTRNAHYPLEIAEFRNYLVSDRQLLKVLCSDIPEDAEAFEIANAGEKLGGRALGSPLLAQLMQFTATHLQSFFSANQLHPIFDFPYAVAGNMFFTHLEIEGSVFIENSRELEEREAMATHRADLKRERDLEQLNGGPGKTDIPPDKTAGLATPPPDLNAVAAGEDPQPLAD